MRFVLQVTCPDISVDGAIVRMSLHDREWLLRRRALFLGVRAYEPELLYMEYADSIIWVENFESHHDAEAVDISHIVKSPGRSFGVKAELAVECERCVISLQGVHWEAVVKHTSVICETYHISWDLIESKE